MEKSIYGDEYREVTNLLKELRKQAGLTQQEVADRLEVTQSYFSKIERGERLLDIIQLRSICHTLESTLPGFVTLLELRLVNRSK